MTRRPTIAAARCRLESVMSFLGSSSRSTWVRLVLSSMAIRALDMFFFFMASASCHATTSLIASACASSKIPSCLRKSSMLEPICFLLIGLLFKLDSLQLRGIVRADLETDNLEAFDAELRCLESFWRFTKDDNTKARQ